MAPKANTYVNSIPQFYRRSTIHHLLFAHVRVLLRENDMTVREAVYDFLEYYQIPETQFDIDTATATYHQLKKMFCEVDGNIDEPKT